jgi:hypothetical protein
MQELGLLHLVCQRVTAVLTLNPLASWQAQVRHPCVHCGSSCHPDPHACPRAYPPHFTCLTRVYALSPPPLVCSTVLPLWLAPYEQPPVSDVALVGRPLCRGSSTWGTWEGGRHLPLFV